MTEEPEPLPIVVPGGTPTADALVLSPRLIRMVLVAIGAAMASRGWIKDEAVNDIVSIGLIVVPIIWDVIVSRLSLLTKQRLADMLPDYLARVERH